MNIKEQNVKYKGSFPHKKFTSLKDKRKFVAEILNNGNGYYKCGYKDEEHYYREDGNIDDWIEELDDIIKTANLTREFLLKIPVV